MNIQSVGGVQRTIQDQPAHAHESVIHDSSDAISLLSSNEKDLDMQSMQVQALSRMAAQKGVGAPLAFNPVHRSMGDLLGRPAFTITHRPLQ